MIQPPGAGRASPTATSGAIGVVPVGIAAVFSAGAAAVFPAAAVMLGGVTFWPRSPALIHIPAAIAAASELNIKRCMRFGKVAAGGAAWQARPKL